MSSSSQPAETPSPPAADYAIAAPPTTHALDKSFYTWTTQFRAMLGRASQAEIWAYNRVYDHEHGEQIVRRAERNRDWLFQRSPIVRFLRDECAALGGDIGPHNVFCRLCTKMQRGGFDTSYGILVCANEDTTRKKMEETLAHELVHAYDRLRWKFDEMNIKHTTCSEIRASTLSGECRFSREFFRKEDPYKFVKHFQSCVRRRATASIKDRPEVRDKDHARSVVDSVWESCFNDTRPFDEIYR